MKVEYIGNASWKRSFKKLRNLTRKFDHFSPSLEVKRYKKKIEKTAGAVIVMYIYD